MKTIALCNQKGGVGKTTTTFHLARAAILAGKKVLAIDLDPQGNLTSVLAKTPVADDSIGIADVLSSRADVTLSEAITAGIWENLDLAPTTGDMLASVRDELIIAGPGRDVRLKDALGTLQDAYDIVLIDCAPAIDQLSLNGLTAADSALIVTTAKLFSSNGLAKLLETIQAVKTYYNPSLGISGVLVNHFEKQTVSAAAWLDDLKTAAEAAALHVFEPPVPKKVVIADAAEASLGLDQWPTPPSDLIDLYNRVFNQL